MVKTKDERIQEAVVAKAVLNPLFHQQFANQPIQAVLSVAKEENIDINEEEAKNVAEKTKGFVAPVVGIEISNLVKDITSNIKRGFESILEMSRVLFYLGVAIIIAAFILDIYGVLTQTNWQVYVASSGVLGVLGLGTILTSFIKGSFEKIKNSVGDLVQINAIFFGYTDQLSIIMKESQEEDSEYGALVDKISSAVEDTVKNIQKYCETAES